MRGRWVTSFARSFFIVPLINYIAKALVVKVYTVSNLLGQRINYFEFTRPTR